MLNRQYSDMLQEKDIIFEIFAYATKRRAEVGAENVFDFSLGNPSVPAPPEVSDAIERCLQMDPMALHSYSPAGGVPEVRERIAKDLNDRYGSAYLVRHIFMTCGAAAAIAHAVRALCSPGETVLTFAPCFSEYKAYVTGAGCQLRIVPPDLEHFQIDFDRAAEMITADTAAVLINSPNNPSGVVYNTETIKKLAALLEEKSKAFGHRIYLISDEPYRDIIFEGTDSPYIGNIYPHTLTCYSYSKSLSLPGERIGYVAAGPECENVDRILEMLPQVSRTTGHNGAPSLLQRVAADCCGRTSDLAVYEKNMNILYKALTEAGYACVRPGGTFYMFVKSPDPDAKAFCKKAMAHDLMLVPGDGFGCPGYFRIAYCVPTWMVERSLPVFEKLI